MYQTSSRSQHRQSSYSTHFNIASIIEIDMGDERTIVTKINMPFAPQTPHTMSSQQFQKFGDRSRNQSQEHIPTTEGIKSTQSAHLNYEWNWPAIARYCIQQPFIRDEAGNTLLHRVFMMFDGSDAAFYAHMLLQQGVFPNGLNKNKMSPLMEAVRASQKEALRFALEYNRMRGCSHFDFSQTCTESGENLMHLACRRGNVAIMMILEVYLEFEHQKEAGASVFETNRCGQTPRQVTLMTQSTVKLVRRFERNQTARRIATRVSKVMQRFRCIPKTALRTKRRIRRVPHLPASLNLKEVRRLGVKVTRPFRWSSRPLRRYIFITPSQDRQVQARDAEHDVVGEAVHSRVHEVPLPSRPQRPSSCQIPYLVILLALSSGKPENAVYQVSRSQWQELEALAGLRTANDLKRSTRRATQIDNPGELLNLIVEEMNRQARQQLVYLIDELIYKLKSVPNEPTKIASEQSPNRSLKNKLSQNLLYDIHNPLAGLKHFSTIAILQHQLVSIKYLNFAARQPLKPKNNRLAFCAYEDIQHYELQPTDPPDSSRYEIPSECDQPLIIKEYNTNRKQQ